MPENINNKPNGITGIQKYPNFPRKLVMYLLSSSPTGRPVGPQVVRIQILTISNMALIWLMENRMSLSF